MEKRYRDPLSTNGVRITMGITFLSMGIPYLIQNSILSPSGKYYFSIILVVLGLILFILGKGKK